MFVVQRFQGLHRVPRAVAPHSPGFTPWATGCRPALPRVYTLGYGLSPRSGARRNEKETFVGQRTQGLHPGL
jgi:hypothetical protein